MRRVRAVYDTNVIVSAALASQRGLVAQGRPSLCLQLALDGIVQLAVSPPLLEEYEAVLLRRKFGFPRVTVRDFVEDLRAAATMTKPVAKLSAELVTDPHDLPVLATAVAAKAGYLVTGNTKHFPRAYGSVSIVTPREFLEAYVGR